MLWMGWSTAPNSISGVLTTSTHHFTISSMNVWYFVSCYGISMVNLGSGTNINFSVRE